MRQRSRTEWDDARARALALLDGGASAVEVAREMGVWEGTVRRWRRRWAELCAASTQQASDDGSVAAMLRREAPVVARVLIDQAKQGDVRAAALVVRLLGNTLNSPGASDDGDRGAASRDLARELDSLPPSVAYEIVGLLAQVGSAAAGGNAVAGETAGEGEMGSVHLPWSEDDSPSDQGGEEI